MTVDVMRSGRTGRAGCALALLGCLAAGVVAPNPAQADPTSDRVAQAQAGLEDSSAAVQAAGVALARTSIALPAAQQASSRARGELAGAQARLAQAQRAVSAGEVLQSAAAHRFAAANAALTDSRLMLGRLARRSYSLGPLQGLRTITESGPSDYLERTALLQQAFKGNDDALHQITVDRLAVAQNKANLDAAQRALDTGREAAASQASRAREAERRGQATLDRVQALIGERRSALAIAQSNRAADLREYQAAQAASRALAARLRAAAEAARRAGTAAVRRAGRMLWPADGPLTSRYGYRTHPIYGDRRLHSGIDIGAGYGAAVSAAEGGTVVYAGAAQGYGTLVVISHGTQNGRDLATAYAHMSSVLVTQGQQVSTGQLVGRVGNEGNSTGPHLHFEVRLDGNPVDPLDYVSPP